MRNENVKLDVISTSVNVYIFPIKQAREIEQESGTIMRQIMSGRGFVDYSGNRGHQTETGQKDTR